MQMFNEAEWIRLLFLISDTQQWINDMERELFLHVPIDQKKNYSENNFICLPTHLRTF